MIKVVANAVPLISGVGLGGSVIGALDHDAALAWIGAGVAIAGAILTAVVQGYHQIRAAKRAEDTLDSVAGMSALGDLLKRTVAVEAGLTAVEARMLLTGCRRPLPDGSARCTIEESPE
jgi:hypothetical protein